MFNARERNGILIAIFIVFIFALIASMRKCGFSDPQSRIISSADSKTISVLELKNKQYQQRQKNNKKENIFSSDLNKVNNTKTLSLREFDPNTVTEAQLKEMGINHKAASNWVKYLKKGGKFYKKEDIQKIFGLTPETYTALSPFVVLKKPEKQLKPIDSASINKTEFKTFERKKEREKLIVDINLADSLELMELYGIGEKLSARIVRYRARLGGFVKVEQLKEVYGLPQETYESIKDQIIVDPKMIYKMKINLADEYILSEFPYIPRREASQIVNYRKQHGKFKNIDDLRKIRSLDEEFILKIEPYLDFGE